MKHITLFAFITYLSLPCMAQWHNDETNIQIVAFGVHDTSLFFSDDHSMFRRYPGGWADTGLDFTLGNFTTFASAGPNFFAGCDGGLGAETTNNGASWTSVIGGPVGSNGTYVFGHYANRLAFSTNQGNSWQHLSYPAGNRYVGTGKAVFMVTTAYWAGTPQAGVWRSLDSGYTWAKLPQQPPFLGTLMNMGSLLFLYQNYRASFLTSDPNHNGTLLLSHDSGMTWDTVHVDSAGLPEYITTLATDGKNLFAGGVSTVRDWTNAYFGNGLYVSTDTGQHWHPANDGLGDPAHAPYNIEAIGIYPHDSTIWISTNNNNYGGSNPSYATYWRPIKEVLDTEKNGVKQVASASVSDSLSIYPNPLSGITTISLTGIPFANVEIYDLLGREVEHFRISGVYEWNASHLPAGTYIVHVRSGAFDQVRRVSIER